MRSEYSANLELLAKHVPAWQKPGKGHRVKQSWMRRYAGAFGIGLIMSIPFIVEIFK